MRIIVFILLGLISASCLSLGFNEREQSYYRWRVNKTFDQIFETTEVQVLKWHMYADDGEGLINRIDSEGIDIETTGYEGVNLLNWAVGAQRYKSVEALLKAGADPDYLNNLEIGNLSLAIYLADETIIRVLAKYGANMQRAPKEYTLKAAISDHGIKLIPLLVELGADPDISDRGGNPLVYATGVNKIDAALLLLDLGATPISTPKEEQFFREDFQKWPFGHPDSPPSGNYRTDEYGELYQRMIGFGVAEPNEAHNQWLIEQGREPNPLD
jgi:ankyrin repeat protein